MSDLYCNLYLDGEEYVWVNGLTRDGRHVFIQRNPKFCSVCELLYSGDRVGKVGVGYLDGLKYVCNTKKDGAPSELIPPNECEGISAHINKLYGDKDEV